MKISLLSDLHLPSQGTQPCPDQAGDVVILAGDIGVGLAGVSWAKAVFTCPVIYVPGNHEYYGRNIDTLDDALRAYVAGTHVHVLQNNQVVIDGVRFIGATLWTDFALFRTEGPSALIAQVCMNDYYVIGTGEGDTLKPSDTLALHKLSRAYLEQALTEPFDGPTVVVTHHAPSKRSVPMRYRGDGLSPCYASRLGRLVASSGACYWCHGHMHESVDYVIGTTRVISNPRGYPGEDRDPKGIPFRWDFTVEIPE